MIRTYTDEPGRFDGPRLMDRLVALFPEWLVGEGMTRQCLLYVQTEVDGSAIYLDFPDETDVELIDEIVEGFESLSASSDKSSMQADGLDTATITIDDARIASDEEVAYRVRANGAEYVAPTSAPVTGGQAQIALTADAPGEYQVLIERQGAGHYETGYVAVSAED